MPSVAIGSDQKLHRTVSKTLPRRLKALMAYYDVSINDVSKYAGYNYQTVWKQLNGAQNNVVQSWLLCAVIALTKCTDEELRKLMEVR